MPPSLLLLASRRCFQTLRRPPPLAPTYDPLSVGRDLPSLWSSLPPAPTLPGSAPFAMMLPPPNVTGALHLGHALTVAIEDALCRHERARGRPVVWVPGCDHAGIATQAVVLRHLEKVQGAEAVRRSSVEERLLAAGGWAAEKMATITTQLGRMGASLDWGHMYFTLDEQRSRAVQEAFVRLADRGLVYRSSRIVNWCPALRTAVSDIEVDYVEVAPGGKLAVEGGRTHVQSGTLYHVSYEVTHGFLAPGECLIAATTRPETVFGDVALAVHPDDPRYQHLPADARVRHPLVPDRELPVVRDATLVDMAFGTGVVKVTPGHDPRDHACGKRHGLPSLDIMNDDGTLRAEAVGPGFGGQDRLRARAGVVRALRAAGRLTGESPHEAKVPVCSRSGDVIEPRVKPQWYVRTSGELAQAALARGRPDGTLGFYPRSPHAATWARWLEHNEDWCVSRQLWWGHPIPAFEVSSVPGVPAGERFIVARSAEEARAKLAAELRSEELAAAATLTASEEVLDTWFSSALLPLSIFGWPDKVPTSPPLDVMETGSDILFFWVARMEMLCSALTGGVGPFKSVVLHPMVRDAQGRKMSKSLGNVVDPVDIMDGITLEGMKAKIVEGNVPAAELKRALQIVARDFPQGIPPCGADALRFTLLSYLSQNRSLNLDPRRVVGSVHLANKIWNAVRFALTFTCDTREELDARVSGLKEATREGLVARMTAQLLPAGILAKSPLPHLFSAAAAAAAAASTSASASASTRAPLLLMDRWILHRLTEAARECDAGFAEFDLERVTTALRRFWVEEFCDVYVEAIKDSKSSETYTTVWACVDGGLRLLHPVMPFLTDALWLHLRDLGVVGSEAIASVSHAPGVSLVCPATWRDENAQREVEAVMAVVTATRTLKGSLKLPGSTAVEVGVAGGADLLRALSRNQEILHRLCKATVTSAGPGLPPPGRGHLALAGDQGVVMIQGHGEAPDSNKAEILQALHQRASEAKDQEANKETPDHVRDQARARRGRIEDQIAIITQTGEK
jgi:valyl-tRNA synthetase